MIKSIFYIVIVSSNMRSTVLLFVVLVASKIMSPADAKSAVDPITKFCTKQGGYVKVLELWNGNPEKGGILIGTPQKACFFPREESADNFYTVQLDTLASKKPTLATLAFLKVVPYAPSNVAPSSNPSSNYCRQLGGATATDTSSAFLPIRTAKLGWFIKGGQVLVSTTAGDEWAGVGFHCKQFVCQSSVLFTYPTRADWSASLPTSQQVTILVVPWTSASFPMARPSQPGLSCTMLLTR